MLQSLLGEEMATGNGQFPVATSSTTAAHPEVQMQAAALQIARRQLMVPQLLEEHGWGEIEAYADSIVQRYKDHNKADRVMPRPGMSEQELQELSYQFEPVRVDPNEISELRQRLVKLDGAMKTQLGTSVFNEPRTMRIARMLNAESGPGTPGYLQSKEQDILGHMPMHERVLMPVREAVMSAADTMVHFGVGAAATLEKLGVLSLDGLTQGNVAAHYNGATSWVQDKDGSWYHNGGKVGGAEAFAAIWYSLTGNLIDQEMAAHEDARVAARMRSSGIEGLAMDTGHVLGSLLPFAALGGGAMAAGTGLSLKGLGWLATGGGAAANLERAAAIVQMLSPAARIAGAAGGLGAYEAIANGHIEGYGAAFMHGAGQAPVLMALGLMGRGVERLLHRTTGMPARMARVLGGAAEGAGFAGIDPHTWDLVWDFIRTPNEETRAALYRQTASNMLAMAIMKGAGGRSPGERALPELAKAVDGEGAARAAAEGGMQPEAMQRFGDLMRQSEVLAGRDPEAARETLGAAGELEGQLRTEAAWIDRGRTEQLEARQAARQRLHELSTAGEGPERFEATERFLSGEQPSAEGRPPTTGPFAEIREQARQEREARVREERRLPEEPRRVERPRDPLGSSELANLPAKVRARIEGAETPRERIRLLEEHYARETQGPLEVRIGSERPGDQLPAPTPERATVTPREKFLESGTDPLMSPRFRDLPADLQRAVLEAPDAAARRQAVLDWRQTRDLSEAELEALGAEPAEVREVSPEYVRRDPGPPSPARGPASLRMKPQLELEGVPGTQPVRESDIFRRMEGFEGDKVRVPIHWGIGIRGKWSTKGVLAWFNRFQHMIRLPKGQAGLNAVLGAHEWAHGMESSVFGDTGRGIPGLTASEQAGLARAAAAYYPGYAKLPKRSQRAEAWAEFWARWMLDDPLLRQETSPFYERAMKWLAADPVLLRQMQEIQGLLRRWRDIGAVERVKSTVRFIEDEASTEELKARGLLANTTPQQAKAGLRNAWRAVQDQVVHDTIGLERAQLEALERQGMTRAEAREAMRKAGPLADPAREIDLLQRTAPRVAERMLGHATTDLLGRETGEAFEPIYKDIGRDRWGDFVTWMVAQHSLEISAKGKLVNAPKEDLLHTVETLDAKHPEFQGFADRLRGFFQRIEDYTVEGGLFTREQWEKFKHVERDPETGEVISEGYRYYIPFDRALDGPVRARIGRIRGPEVGSSVRTQHGSTHQEIQDPRLSIEKLVHRVVTDVHRGMAMKAMLKFSLTHPKVGGFVTEVAQDRIPKHATIVEVVKALTATGNPSAAEIAKVMDEVLQTGDDLGGAITLWSMARTPKGERPVVAYTPHFLPGEIASLPTKTARQVAAHMDGKLLWLEMDPMAFERMRDLGARQTIFDALPPFWHGLLTAPAAVARLGGTALNPVFAIAQIIPDAITKFLFSARPMPLGPVSAIGHAIRGIVELAKGEKSKDAELWRNLGGGYESTFSGAELAARKRPGTALEAGASAFGFFQKIIDKAASFLSAGEQGPRLDEFQFVRQKALAEGRSELEANQLAMEAAQKITVDFARGGTVARAGNQIIAYLKAPINATEQFVRVFSGAEGHEKQMRAIQRGLVGLVLPSIVLWWLNRDEQWYQDLTEEDRLNFWWFKIPGIADPFRLKKREIGMVFGSTPEMVLSKAAEKDPIATVQFVKNAALSFLPSSLVPNVGAPFLEWTLNGSLFSGRPTVPEWMQEQRIPAEQAMPFTRTPALLLGRALNMSPAKIDQFLSTATGGLYGRVTDIAEDVATLAGTTTREGFSPSKLPFIGPAFLRAHPRSRAIEALYDLHRSLVQQQGSGVLDFRGQEARNITADTVARIAALHRAQGAGQLTRQQVRDQSADLARQALARINR